MVRNEMFVVTDHPAVYLGGRGTKERSTWRDRVDRLLDLSFQWRWCDLHSEYCQRRDVQVPRWLSGWWRTSIHFSFSANDAKDRQKWIDKLRTSSGSNAADLVSISHLPTSALYFFFWSLPPLFPRRNPIWWALRLQSTHHLKLKHACPIDETQSRIEQRLSSSRRVFGYLRIYHHQQTLKEMKEVLHCVELNQRDFVETIDVGQLFLFRSTRVFRSRDYPMLSRSIPCQK